MRRRPDVALVMNVANGFWLPLLRLRGVPTVVNVDGIEWERVKWSRAGRWVFRVGARLTARWATEIVVDSMHIGTRWRTELGRDGTFIPYGGDTGPVSPLDEGLEHRRYVLMVARFVPENSLPAFFDAAEAIAAEFDVVIVGSSGYGGEFDDRARLLSATNGRIKWLGHINDDARLLALWTHAGVYFHGHTVGGTNPALVQAMTCGAPIVARDTVYNDEVLAGSGVLVSGSADDIAHAILSLLREPERQEVLSGAARARALAEYSWVAVCESYERLIRSVAERTLSRGD